MVHFFNLISCQGFYWQLTLYILNNLDLVLLLIYPIILLFSISIILIDRVSNLPTNILINFANYFIYRLLETSIFNNSCLCRRLGSNIQWIIVIFMVFNCIFHNFFVFLSGRLRQIIKLLTYLLIILTTQVFAFTVQALFGLLIFIVHLVHLLGVRHSAQPRVLTKTRIKLILGIVSKLIIWLLIIF